MKRIVQISLFVLFAMSVAALMGFVYIENGKMQVNDIIVRIDRDTETGFLSKDKLRTMIVNHDSSLKRQIKEVNTDVLEQIVSRNVYVEDADVYLDMSKDIVINVSEKTPLLRIYSKKGVGYYIDKNGKMIPLSPLHTARVMVANGYISTQYNKEQNDIFDTVFRATHLGDLFKLTNLINENKFLYAQIAQIYVNSKGEYDLIPNLGDHLIQFGGIEDANEKLEKLEVWYKKAFVKEDFEKYATINLKFKNQVVCTKK